MSSSASKGHRTGIWLGVACVSLALALLLSPTYLLSRLPAEAESFRSQLVEGITLVRLGLAAAAALALLSAFCWRPEAVPRHQARTPRPSPADYLAAVAILALTGLLMALSLPASYEGDEMGTLVRVVKRGPLVILSFSCSANNHIANSLLMWLMLVTVGEGEVQMRLPAFLLGTLTPQAVFWSLRGHWGRWHAAFTAALVGVHFWVVAYAGQARGYSGAVLFSFLACAFFAEMLRRQRGSVIALYILSAVLSFGFIATTILVPLAHGLAASALYLHQRLFLHARPTQRADSLSAVVCCLWVGILAVVLFGLPAPQTFAYAVYDSHQSHLPLSPQLVMRVANYVTGSAFFFPSLLLLILSSAGWIMLRGDRLLYLAFLTPAVLAVCYLALPGARLSPRLFCFLIPPFILGTAALFHGMARQGALARVGVAALLLVWVASAMPLHWRLLATGNPDLKGLAARLEASRVMLTGQQADLNVYYFPHAKVVKAERGAAFDPEELLGVDVIIEGVWSEDTADPILCALGYELTERLSPWMDGSPRFLVYRKPF
jgi:hypothetical protein